VIERALAGVVVALTVAGAVPAASSVPFSLSSTAFRAGGTIPKPYTCDGRNVSPPFRWTAPPAGTKAFAILMDDPDATIGTFLHWTAWNIPARTRSLGTGQRPQREGANGAGSSRYIGPCPPSGVHRYIFRLYALEAPLKLAAGAAREEFVAALRGKVLATARLVGRYGR
jgi:Raf kinase inhibitor-like YbhB/YbcL family protein